MKIALIGPTYPFRGGISHYTTLLNSHLQKKHQVQFYTFSRPYPKLLYPGNASPDQSTMRFSNKNTISIIDWANPFSWIKTGLLIIRWSPQIIIFPWWMWGWAIPFWVIAKIASLRNKVKTLFICHNIIEHEAAFLEKCSYKICPFCRRFLHCSFSGRLRKSPKNFPGCESNNKRSSYLWDI